MHIFLKMIVGFQSFASNYYQLPALIIIVVDNEDDNKHKRVKKIK